MLVNQYVTTMSKTVAGLETIILSQSMVTNSKGKGKQELDKKEEKMEGTQERLQ